MVSRIQIQKRCRSPRSSFGLRNKCMHRWKGYTRAQTECPASARRSSSAATSSSSAKAIDERKIRAENRGRSAHTGRRAAHRLPVHRKPDTAARQARAGACAPSEIQSAGECRTDGESSRLISRAFFSVMPGISVSRSGSFSRTSRLDAPKRADDLLCRLCADALDRARGKKRENLRLRLRHQPLQKLRFKLRTVARMASPSAGNDEAFADNRHRNRADDGHKLAIFRAQLQNAIAVFRILITARSAPCRESSVLPASVHVLSPSSRNLRKAARASERKDSLCPAQKAPPPAAPVRITRSQTT